ncbi:MAG: hypothetical protein J6L77_10330 [Coprococcus sp.]|nr:hypothetical protein [Coprococcus sp.]
MNLSYVLGIVAGIALVLIIFIILSKKTDAIPVFGTACQYDERQLQARGRAYKAAYFTLMICVFAEAFADMFLERKLFTSLGGLGLAIFVSIGVFAVTCIIKDAYMGLYEKIRGTLITFFIIALLNLWCVVLAVVKKDKLIENGEFSYVIINIGIVILYIVIMAALLIKLRLDKKAEAGE